MYIADLHIHSRFSRATSKDCDIPHLDWWAQRKGIQLLGTGDFTHPVWRAELKEQLVPAGEGVYTLKKDLRIPNAVPGETPRFVVTGEISSIYKKDGKTRKVHNVIVLPSIEAADELAAKLEAIGNIHSDGRPILGLDSRDLLEITLETCPDTEFIPAHIWTPHFSMFGAFSGFDSIEACFGDLTPHIHAVETGLSSDPPMNWRVSALDNLTLVSHSDAHSPSKLGREANLLDTGLTYPELVHAIRTGEGFLGTVEFFPEEGKYHLDGHRNCNVCLTPAETTQLGGICPVCGKKITIGVEHRVEELADRPIGYRPENAKPFESLAPLPEVVAACTGKSVASKKTQQQYEEMLQSLGSEFYILRQAPIEDIKRTAGPCIAEGIRRLRIGQVERKPGFDGEYGVISLLSPSEIEQLNGQISLFGADVPKKSSKQQSKIQTIAAPAPEETPIINTSDRLNTEQQKAVSDLQRVVAVIAGPGTGKTKTLVSRIAYLIEEQGVKPEEITAVTFTNQAATEMRHRLEQRLGGKRAISRMTIGTFHAICLKLLGDVRPISEGEAIEVAEEILQTQNRKENAKQLIQSVSQIKNGASFETAELSEELYLSYCSRLQELGVLDFDDLLLEAQKQDVTGQKQFTHLLVDEFQDINDIQYQLVQKWNESGKNLFVIGDPDQSIYGFRGSSGRCFERLEEDSPDINIIRLVQNYRSSPEILQTAVPVIEHNPGKARLLTPNQTSGIAVRLVQTADDFSEGIWIAKEISRMTGGVDMLEAQSLGHTQHMRSFSDIAVLCRTHRQLELIEKCLRHDDIPCIISGREDFLNTDDVRGILSFFRCLQDPGDIAALRTALKLLWNCPSDLIEYTQKICSNQTEWSLETLQHDFQGYEILLQMLGRIESWLPLIQKEKPWKLVQQWEEKYGSSPALEKLKNTAVFHSNLEELWNALVLGQEADISRTTAKNWKSGAVHLMSLHGSKGLEFPAVFVSGIKSGILPLESTKHPTDIQEERRLFYVGMTRAREELILTCGAEPSSFLSELPNTIKGETVKRREQPAEQLSLF